MASLFDGGDLTFSLDVGGDGAASLRTTIMKKLSEFMGSYTDDVLAVRREREREGCVKCLCGDHKYIGSIH